MEKLGTVPAASWFKNNYQVLFRFSVYLSWFSGELGTWAPWFGKTYGERRNKKVVHRSQMGRPRIWQISLSHISSRTQNKSESPWHLKRSLAISSHIMFSFLLAFAQGLTGSRAWCQSNARKQAVLIISDWPPFLRRHPAQFHVHRQGSLVCSGSVRHHKPRWARQHKGICSCFVSPEQGKAARANQGIWLQQFGETRHQFVNFPNQASISSGIHLSLWNNPNLCGRDLP